MTLHCRWKRPLNCFTPYSDAPLRAPSHCALATAQLRSVAGASGASGASAPQHEPFSDVHPARHVKFVVPWILYDLVINLPAKV